jgi:diguanylate cyclase (GGDEF)-like protein
VFERKVRRSDIISRLGGDEFSILLPGIESTAKATEIANCIIDGVSEPIDIGDGRRAQVGASIGIAFAESAQETPASFLRRADIAMYGAKQDGRGRASVADMPGDEDDESDAA